MQPEIDVEPDWGRIGGKVEKKNICSNGQKKEASRLGVKSGYEVLLLQWQNWRMKQSWGKEIENSTFAPTGRKEKQAELEEKLKKRIFAPTGRKEKQAELEEKLKKRIFAPTGRRDKQADLGKEIENSTFAPAGRKEKQAELEEKVEKKNICSNRQKREAS